MIPPVVGKKSATLKKASIQSCQVGDKELEGGQLTVRRRGEEQATLDKLAFIEQMLGEIKTRKI